MLLLSKHALRNGRRVAFRSCAAFRADFVFEKALIREADVSPQRVDPVATCPACICLSVGLLTPWELSSA